MFFRLGTADLAVGVATTFVASAAAGLFLHDTDRPTPLVGALGLGLVTYLVCAPPIYRALRMRPMHFPRCPHCNAADGPWGFRRPSAALESEDALCGQCGHLTTFAYAGKPEGDGPAYALRWPRPLGRWKRVR